MKDMLMGIENEFEFMDSTRRRLAGRAYFHDILNHIGIPYFKKGNCSVRLATGGAFYIDGAEPEITTAPYILEKGAVSAVTANLMLTRNLVVQAIEKLNDEMSPGTYHFNLKGYSAHYNFSFPNVRTCDIPRELCYELAKTVNPAIQLLTENRRSHGVMFRTREEGRIEICADYIPKLDDVIAAVGFQAAMFSTIRSWMESGMKIDELHKINRYRLPVAAQRVSLREGVIIKTPNVLMNGRSAALVVHDRDSGKFVTKTAQELLLHYARLFEEGMDAVLTKEEKRLVMDSVSERRKLPIDATDSSLDYEVVKCVNSGPHYGDAPLQKAFGNAVAQRTLLPGVSLTPSSMSWKEIVFFVLVKGQNEQLDSGRIRVPLDNLAQFENLIATDANLFRKIIVGNLPSEEEAALGQNGFSKELLHSWNLTLNQKKCPSENTLDEAFLREYSPLRLNDFLHDSMPLPTLQNIVDDESLCPDLIRPSRRYCESVSAEDNRSLLEDILQAPEVRSSEASYRMINPPFESLSDSETRLPSLFSSSTGQGDSQ